MRFANCLAAVAIALSLTGCATNTVTGRSQLMLVSEKSAIAQSASAYTQMVDELHKKGKLSTDEKLIARINDLTNRLIDQAVLYRPETRSWSWSMEVIDDPKTVNAFCMAGGKMAVYTGLIEKIQPTDDELVQVIGHEIAHALANHSAEKMSVAMASNIGIAVLATAAGRSDSERRGLYTAGGLAAMAIVTLPNSRQAESEADRLGIELAARAGYNPDAAVSLWKKMMEESKDKSRSDFFSTHPSPANRIDALAALGEPMKEIYRASGKNRHAAPYGWIGRSANERPLADNKPSLEGGAQMFYTPEYHAFQKGTAALTCTGECGAGYFMKQSGLKDEYDKKNWRVLAVETVKTNYKLDLTYYYLASAAKGLGFPAAARKYFEEARRLATSEEFACAKRSLVGCSGIDVPKKIAEELPNLPAAATP